MAEFNISLGIKLDENDLKKVKQQIDSLGNNEIKIAITPVKMDATKKELSSFVKNARIEATKAISTINSSIAKNYNNQINIGFNKEKLNADINIMKEKLEYFLISYNNLSDKTRESVRKLIDDLNIIDDSSGLSNINKKFQQIQASAKTTGELVKTVFSFDVEKMKSINHINQFIKI